jgi:hypothetical protein
MTGFQQNKKGLRNGQDIKQQIFTKKTVISQKCCLQ